MKMLDRFNRHAALFTGALLLCANLAAHADEIEDANRLFKQGQRNEALDKVNDYLASKPKDAQARFLKGLILTEQGKTADAIKIFSALTDDYPDLPEPYNNLAVLYASQGQYDKAKTLLEMAISTHPSYATAHENLGDIYAKMASQAYDRALQLDHDNTATQTKLAMIQSLFSGASHNAVPAHTVAPVPAKPETSVVAEAGQPESAAVAADSNQPGPAAPVQHVGKRDESRVALETVMAWAAAWSAKDTNKYLSFYTDDFKTPGGETRAAWEAVRRERLSKPKYIHVGIRIMTIEFSDSNHATVKFRQSYHSSNLKSTDNKTLLLEKIGDKWLIQEERSR